MEITREIEKETDYLFTLNPEGPLEADIQVEITFPSILSYDENTLEIYDTTTHPMESLSASKIRINSVLVTNPLSQYSYIQFIATPILNPNKSYNYSDAVFEIAIKNNDLSVILYTGNISIASRDGGLQYEPHPLDDVNIEPGSRMLCTKSTYTINFTNTGYIIPTGSKIKVEFPDTFEIGSVNSIPTNLHNLSSFTLVSSSTNNLLIDGGFLIDLIADQVIQFTVEDILNPYALGLTESVKIFISVEESDDLFIFAKLDNLQINIDTQAIFPVFTIIPATTVTSEIVNYTITAEIKDRPISTDYYFIIKRPEEVQGCISSSIQVINGFTAGETGDEDDYRYTLKIGSEIAAKATVEFQIECKNPYTTQPPTGVFCLQIMKIGVSDSYVYYDVESMHTMTTAHSFSALTITHSLDYPRRRHNVVFNIVSYYAKSSLSSSVIDQIFITVSDSMEIFSCAIDQTTGFIGAVMCIRDGTTQTVIIKGFTEVDATFSFRLLDIRNPNLVAEDRYFTVSTNIGEYVGESQVSTITHIPCDFPCKTCSPLDPTSCDSCYDYGDEVFGDSECDAYLWAALEGTCSCNGNYLYLLYVHIYIYIFYLDDYMEGSEITVSNPTLEIESDTNYSFKLGPRINLAVETLFQINLPIELKSTNPCLVSPGTISCNYDPTKNNILLTGVLSTEYEVDVSTFITFNITPITNPEIAYNYSDIRIVVKTDPGELSGFIPISNIGSYEAHNLTIANVISTSNLTVTSASFKFSFSVNSGYKIPQLSDIIVKIPSSMKILATKPSLTDLTNLDPGITTVYNSPYFVLIGGFPADVDSDISVEFTLGDILTPYQIGVSDAFQLSISSDGVGNAPNKFERLSGLTVDIEDKASFVSFGIRQDTLITNQLVFYTFTLELGDGELNTNHNIAFKRGDLYHCIANSDSVTLGEGTLLDIVYVKFTMGCTVPAHSTFNFKVKCRNPATIQPELIKVHIWAYDTGGNITSNVFYQGHVLLPQMTTPSTFKSISVTLLNKHPRDLNNLTFSIESAEDMHATEVVNQIKITADEIDFSLATFTVISGISGTVNCSPFENTTFTCEGITKLETTYQFKIVGPRNPSLTNQPIAFNVLTMLNPNNYYGENGTTTEQIVECNFPCLSCPEADDLCESCFESNSEAFKVDNQILSMLYMEEGKCLKDCPTHTYNDTATTCTDCNALCKECSSTANQCTKCFPDGGLFLYQEECKSDCPDGYIPNYEDWTCVGYFQSDSEIIVQEPIEMEMSTKYTFRLRPTTNLSAFAVFNITLPAELNIEGDICASSKGNCNLLTSKSMQITEILSEAHDTLTSFITFTIEPITNPNRPLNISDLLIEVTTINSTTASTYFHKGEINLGNSGKFGAHPIMDVMIYSSCLEAAKKSSYKFSFTNSHVVPAGSKIQMNMVGICSNLTASPNITNKLSLSESLNAGYGTGTVCINNAFSTDLPPGNTIQFQIEDVQNTYQVGVTPTFTILIYLDPDLYMFTKSNGLTVNIVEGYFNSFSVSAMIPTTNIKTNYTFQVQNGETELNTNHYIIITRDPNDNAGYDQSTLISEDGSTPIGDIAINTPLRFNLAGIIPAGAIFNFIMECRNPPTTRPSNNFTIQGYLISTDTPFIRGSGVIQTMTDISHFASISVTASHLLPTAQNTLQFSVERTGRHNSPWIDQIRIELPSDVEILYPTNGCLQRLKEVVGLEGTLICSITGQIIIISGITLIERIFSFELELIIRNPSTVDIPIYTIFTTQHSEGYYSEMVTTSDQFVDCNFPCWSCLADNPDACTDCPPIFHESFIYYGEGDLYLLNDNSCLTGCPTHTYFDESLGDICAPCDPSCSECNLIPTNCTQCFESYWLDWKCIVFPCPEQYGSNNTTWTCDRTIIIYIIYLVCTAGTYYNDFDHSCDSKIFVLYEYLECDSRCLFCDGPNQMDCLVCSTITGVAQQSDGTCDCQDMYFFEYDAALDQETCQRI